MKTRLILFLLAAAVLFSVLPASAQWDQIWSSAEKEPINNGSANPSSVESQKPSDEKQLWSNFNRDPVLNGPAYKATIPLLADADPVLITKIRTYHWNNGAGAAPGKISVYDSENKTPLGTWQAVGRTSNGVPNAYWEAVTDCLLTPGHKYYITVSDNSSWSYNNTSDDCGMFELYGISPASEEYVPSGGTPTEEIVALPAELRAGSTFFMGTYEQDNNLNNGPEPVEWQILSVKDDRILVISKNILDAKSFPEMASGSSWETTSLRSWLNGEFLNTAFSPDEKSLIITVTNENPDNPQFKTAGGNKTKDTIFLLSINEVEGYFESDQDRSSQATEFANEQSQSFFNMYGGAMWYLRSPGLSQTTRAVVGKDGEINYGGPACVSECQYVYFGMRPAFWLRIVKPAGFTVTYLGGNCLTQVPMDNRFYSPGETVTVLFDPVAYVSGMIFSGWDWDNDSGADFGYYYNTFTMPNKNVTLIATCYPQYYYYDNQNTDHGTYDNQQYVYPDNNYQYVYPDGNYYWIPGNDYGTFFDGVG
ncbi:MAG: hypothetical protein IKP86_07925 [Anaerolineaceae bacterium]|nr:hypothetical protein [Anaerolineaceae bacterium]